MKSMHDPLRWTTRLIQSFYSRGVRHAVISPGSRSTPLTIAAAIHPGFKKKVVLDERSAGFIALGIGKASGKPALLICTSGTAAANYLPAIIEAKESGTPMIVLTADRPPNLRGIGSSQTIDQVKLFGNQTVFFHEAGEPVIDQDDLNRIEYLAEQAIQESIMKGGAAHINMPFRKPLEPTADQLERATAESHIQAVNQSNVPRSTFSRSLKFTDEIRDLFDRSSKPLIIAGPANIHQSLERHIQQIVKKAQIPVISEPGSKISAGTHSINRFDQLLRNPERRSKLKPDLILLFGDQPFTKPVLTALESWREVPVIQFLSRNTWQDHYLLVSHRLIIEPADTLDLGGLRLSFSKTWFDTWKRFDSELSNTLGQRLKESGQLTDGHVFKHLSGSIPLDWNVMLSNSFPVRDMAQFGLPSANQYVNRGAAGIDGILSTAAGIAESTSKPTCCLLGDLAFLHDSNALFSIKSSAVPIVTVVINNGGGTIFRMLPVHKMMDNGQPSGFFRAYFETPQDIEIQFLANASGINYLRIESLDDLAKHDIQSFKKSIIIECVTDADESMKLREFL